jgi:serine/threonine-protein kinase HipA
MFEVVVVKNKYPIGTLTETNKAIIFEYFEEVNPDSYLMGLKKETNSSNILFPIFENLLPENEQLESLKVKYKIKNKIGILLYLSNIHGSFEFYAKDDFKKKNLEAESIFTYSDEIDNILDQNYQFPNILEYTLDIPFDKLYPVEFNNNKLTGLSGFQYKFSVDLDKKNKVIKYNHSDNSEYIMKPYNKGHSVYKPLDKDSSYIPYLLVNEHIFMSIARDFGFKVPYNAIIEHNGDYHYLIKRYDRFNGMKIDHHEILTLLDKQSKDKYKVFAVTAIQKASEYLNKKETKELFRFFIFSTIIAHGDFHAKNISLIYKTNALNETKMQLAPYYDISTVGIYSGIDNNDIGMKIKNKNIKISIEDFIWLGSKFSISEDETRTYVTELSNKFKDDFLGYIDLLPKHIKSLPYYTNRYMNFNSLDVIFKKYYDKRINYIDKYLLKIKKVKEDIWG